MKYFLLTLAVLFLNCSQLFINSSKWRTVTNDKSSSETETVQSPFSIDKRSSTTPPSGYIQLVDFGEEFDYKEIEKVILHVNGGNGKNTTNIELRNVGSTCYYDYQELSNKLKAVGIDDVKCYSATLEIHLDSKSGSAKLYSAPAYLTLNSDLQTVQLVDTCACEEESEPPTPKIEETATPIDPAPPTDEFIPTKPAEDEHDYLCILDKKFKNKIELSPDSKVYKFNFIDDESAEQAIYFKTAKFKITNYIDALIDSLTTESRKNSLRQWVEDNTVAFLFVGSASAPEIMTDRITADEGDLTYFRWDTTSNCLVEQSAQYNNTSIRNADLPILRACNSADRFAAKLESLLPDIQSRLFPVALDPEPEGGDLEKFRYAKIYLIGKPQLTEFK